MSGILNLLPSDHADSSATRMANNLAQLMLQKPAPGQVDRSSSRRRKLWELPHKFHCPVIGVCFGVDELRALLGRVMHWPRDTSDFVLHTSAVGQCDSRSRLAEVLQKNLEKRYQLLIRRFATANNSKQLRRLWKESGKTGCDVPGALWACWTHPACDAQLEHEIYGDIHMLQHQIGSGSRSELTTLNALRSTNQQLRQQLLLAQSDVETLRADKSSESRRLGQLIAALRAELAGHEACTARLTGQLETLRQSLPELKDRQTLARRASDAEARADALAARLAEQENAAERWRAQCQAREIQEIQRSTAENTQKPTVASAGEAENLLGRCVLCVGGRSGAVDAYRKIVEERGGRFLHHDGGQEESLHRIDAALAAADLVICQAGCISHNAYWRVKEQCKRSGTRCIFLRNPGISSFGRIVGSTAPTAEKPALT